MFAILNWSGTHPVLKNRLKMIFKGVDRYVLKSFNKYTGILKGPTAFEEFKLEISFSISTAVTGDR